MESEFPNCLWISTLSWRVTPKPLSNTEGESPPMPRTCLPLINPRRFMACHDKSSKAKCLWSSGRAKSNLERCKEPDSPDPSIPTCLPLSLPAIRPKYFTRALEKGLKDIKFGDIPRRFRIPLLLPFLNAEDLAQGIRNMQKVVTVHHSQSEGRKLFISCLMSKSGLKSCESEPQVHPTQPAPLSVPQGSGMSSEAGSDSKLPPAGLQNSQDQEMRKGLRLIPCLKGETDSEVDSENLVPTPLPYLAPIKPEDIIKGRKTLVLNLHGTLIHSTLGALAHDQCDFKIPAWVNQRLCEVFVVKRPGLDMFLEQVARRYEVVVFTSCPRQYTDLIVDLLDGRKCIRYRLYEDACIPTAEGWVKDLSVLGRDLTKVITVDSKPNSYRLQPANSLVVGSFSGDKNDRELFDLLLDLELVWRLNV